ncbi:MAG: hypothetical protein H6712_10930 [Myxococcales bacterium]|nr:hypothetical protein [Myxococcales bacterium]MCB9714364.1 hypothetical protein [Myxococcales bacterium]
MLRGCVVMGLLAAGAVGCHGRGASSEPEPARSAADCDPLFGCDDLLGGSTVRQHSMQAASFTALSAGCPMAPEQVPPLDELGDDSIPQLDRSRSRRSNFHRGDESLQEVDLHEHLMGMQGQIFACVDLAACYDDGAELSGSGELDFEFELTHEGRVAAVSVTASPGLDHPSVIACARRAMFEYRFPSYDGGQMMISYSMTIEAVDGDA